MCPFLDMMANLEENLTGAVAAPRHEPGSLIDKSGIGLDEIDLLTAVLAEELCQVEARKKPAFLGHIEVLNCSRTSAEEQHCQRQTHITSVL